MINEPNQTPYASPSAVGVKPDARLSQAFLTQAFAWMFAGLMLTAAVTYFVSGNARALSFASDNLLFIIIAQLGLQELLGERGLARVGVADDGEGAPVRGELGG